MNTAFEVLRGLLFLVAVWVLFFVCVMSCFVALMWFVTLTHGRERAVRRRRQF